MFLKYRRDWESAFAGGAGDGGQALEPAPGGFILWSFFCYKCFCLFQAFPAPTLNWPPCRCRVPPCPTSICPWTPVPSIYKQCSQIWNRTLTCQNRTFFGPLFKVNSDQIRSFLKQNSDFFTEHIISGDLPVSVQSCLPPLPLTSTEYLPIWQTNYWKNVIFKDQATSWPADFS